MKSSTLYCLERHICDASVKKKKKKVYQEWVGRQKEPILGYVPKNYEKKDKIFQTVKG